MKLTGPTGFMGTALIEGLLRDANSPRDDEITFTACVRSQASVDRLRQKFAQSPSMVQVVQGELAKAAARADVVMLGCQPQELADLIRNHDHAGKNGDRLVDALKHKLVISLLAGVSGQQLLDALLDASAPATAGSTALTLCASIRTSSFLPISNPAKVSWERHRLFNMADAWQIPRLTPSSQNHGSEHWVFLNASRRAPDAICQPRWTAAGS